MNQALRFDTLAFVRRLEEAGADEKLAETIAEGLSAVDTSGLATKADLRELGTALRAEFRAGLADVRSDILRWMFGAMAVQTALLVALIRVF